MVHFLFLRQLRGKMVDVGILKTERRNQRKNKNSFFYCLCVFAFSMTTTSIKVTLNTNWFCLQCSNTLVGLC